MSRKGASIINNDDDHTEILKSVNKDDRSMI